jgi:hypothetical protein
MEIIWQLTVIIMVWSLAKLLKMSFPHLDNFKYEGVSKSFQTGHLEQELQMIQLSATGCSCIAILWVSLMSHVAITLCVASQKVVVVYFVINSVQKLLDTCSYDQHKLTQWATCHGLKVPDLYLEGIQFKPQLWQGCSWLPSVSEANFNTLPWKKPFPSPFSYFIQH